MKLKSYLFLGLAALMLSSCDQSFNDWASPQTSEQDAMVSFGDGSITEVSVIDLAKIPAGTDSVQVCKITAPTTSDAKYKPTYQIFLNGTPYAINANGMMSVADLTDYVVKTYGKRPTERDIPSIVRINLGNGTTATRIDSKSFNVKAIPQAPVIENAYYLIGGQNGWSATDKTYLLTNSGKDVYEDPVFSIVVPSLKNGDGSLQSEFWFKIAAESAYSQSDFWGNGTFVGVAVNGQTDLTGKIVVGKENNPQAWKIDQVANPAKYYKIEVNMLDQTYTITPMNDPELYLTGDHYGWGATWKPLVPVYDTNDTFWTIIYLHSGEQFKFAPQAGWGNDFGMQATINDVAGAGITDNGGNITSANAGWYLLKVVNGATKSVDILKPNVYLMGDAAGEWNISDTHLFTVPTTETGQFVSPAFANNAELRICVNIGFDWWKTEFIVNAAGKIDYRGKGGDQTRVNVTVGQKAYLNFSNNTGSIQ